MAVEILHYPDGTLFPEQFADILVEIQDRYVGYLFLFKSKNSQDYLAHLSQGKTPTIGFLFKKINTFNDYLIVVSPLTIYHPMNYEQGDSSGDSSRRFVQAFNLLEYLAKVEFGEGINVVKPIAYFDGIQLGEDYNENDLDIKALSDVFNNHLLNQLPTSLLNPTWSRSKRLFDSVEQAKAIMSMKTNIHDLLGKGCYGLPTKLHSQMFTVWETGESKLSNLNFLEMAKKLRNFFYKVNASGNNAHLKSLNNVYSAISYCISELDEEVIMRPALILSDAQDKSRLEIIPSGWDNDTYVQRLPNTKHFGYSGIEHDGTVFKLFQY